MRKGSRVVWWQLVAGGAVGVACLWYSLRGVDLSAARASLAGVSWPWVILAVLGVLSVSAGKALRWQWLYPPDVPRLPYRSFFSVLLIAQMLNVLVPIRLGEIARMGLMRQEGHPPGLTLGAIAIEKSLDLLAVGLLLLIAVPAAVLPGWLEARGGSGSFLVGGALLLALLLLGHARHLLRRWVDRIPRCHHPTLRRWQVRLLGLVTAFLDGLAGIEGRRAWPALVLTALVWAISAGAVHAMLLAFGLGGRPETALVLMIALTFSNLIPTPPAMIGVVGAVTEAVLAPLGVAPSRVFALGAVLNVVVVVPPVLLGSAAAAARAFSWLGGEKRHWRQALGLAPVEINADE